MAKSNITSGDIQAFVRECREVGARMEEDPSRIIGAFEQSHATSKEYMNTVNVAEYALDFLNLVKEYGCSASLSRDGDLLYVDTLYEDGVTREGDGSGVVVSVKPEETDNLLLSHSTEDIRDIIKSICDPYRYETVCYIEDGVNLDRAVALWLIYQADQMRPGLLDRIGQLTANN